MKKALRLAIAAAAICTATSVYADTTGQDYINLPPRLQLWYIGGMWDMSLGFAKDSNAYRIFITCAVDQKHMTYGQVKEILNKYVMQHPEDWQDPAFLLLYEALKEACKDI